LDAIDTTATVAARPSSTTGDAPRRNPVPLDLNAMRPAFASAPGATSTTTPSALPWKAAAQPVPAAAQAYAAPSTPDGIAPLPSSAPSATPGSKIQARLAALEPVALKAEAAKSEPARPEPAKAEAKADLVERSHERLTKTMTSWVIQLGAMDDEVKAKAVLEEARSRLNRILVKAAPFTEKVVREGATLYRARFSGFNEADSAQEACKTLKRSGFNCFATRS
jgi:D-alanyl-D-alanine carboxypeptidase